MSYLNYSIGKTFSLLLEQFRLSSFISICLSCIILGIVLYINKNSKIIKYIFMGINAILLCFILFLYLKGILSFNYSNPLKNIYVYFLNSVVYLIICIILNKKIIRSKLYLIFYVLNNIGIAYSIIMTLYLKNITIIVIGNIFPQIFFGNILILISYIAFIVTILTKKK